MTAVAVQQNSALPVGRRRQAIAMTIFWPGLSALLDAVRYPRLRTLAGFVGFCGYAGWTFRPLDGSDGDAYAQHILDAHLGFSVKIGEPIPKALVTLVGSAGFDPSWYFMMVGILYGLAVSVVAKLLFRHVAPGDLTRFTAIFFLLAFFLNYPVFAAVNARYYLGLWMMIVATMCAMEERWGFAAAVSCAALMTHFGMSLYILGLGYVFATRKLDHWQIILTYAVLAISIVIPPGVYTAVGGHLASLVGGSFGAKVSSSVAYAELTEFGSNMSRNEDTAWFLVWANRLILVSLLVSGHLLWLRIRHATRDPQCQLWMLAMISWALMMVVSGDPEASARLGRNIITLLLLFHARWFLFRRDLFNTVFLINAAPMLLYFVVNYRRWLEQANLVTFLPLPWTLVKDSYPGAMQLLFG
jgi:hypothetical protein